MPPHLALEKSRRRFESVKKGPDGFSYWFTNEMGHASLSPPYLKKSRAQLSRASDIVKHAIALAGGLEDLLPCYHGADGLIKMTMRERQAYNQIRVATGGPLKVTQWSPRRRAAWERALKDVREGNRHISRTYTPEQYSARRRQRWERDAMQAPLPPLAPDTPAAIASASARIAARRPDLPPATVAELARWVAGAL